MEQRQTRHRMIKPNHSNALPRYLVAFHVLPFENESKQSNRKFAYRWRCGAAVYGRFRNGRFTDRKTAKFLTPDEFWAWLVSLTGQNYTVWVVGCNVLFDFILSEMDQRFERGELAVEWPRSKRQCENNREDNPHCQSLCVIESPPTIIACKCGLTNGRIVFVDTLNWFSVPVEDLGTYCDLPAMVEPVNKSSVDYCLEYCQRTSKIVFKTFAELIFWVKANEMGMFRYTGPSQAMSAYRHRFMRHNIFPHENEPVRKIERAGLFGGRTDVFKIGPIIEVVHQVDVAALFPAVMRLNFYPVALHRFDILGDYLELLPAIEWQSSIAEVELRSDEPLYPQRRGNLVVFPSGRFRTVLCGNELLHAVKTRRVLAIRSWAEYRCEPIFTEWVETLWRMRLEYRSSGNRLYEQFVKYLANSLYGKFGQRSPRWVNVKDWKGFLPWSTWIADAPGTKRPTMFRSFGWQAQYMTEREEIDGTFIAISAFVTANARMTMNYLRSVAGKGNVFYQGVDGLIVTPAGLRNLDRHGELMENRLGKLRLELTTDNGEILGCSDYRLGDKVIVAGRSKTYTPDGLDTGLQRKFYATQYLFSGKAISTVGASDIEWHRQHRYDKGVVTSGGWIEPFNLNEGRSNEQPIKVG